MGVRKSRPTTPGRRAMSHSTFDEVTRSEPEKRLTRPNSRKAGRNVHGRITARHQGGGHKQKYRIIDFRRDKDGIPARVAEIEYDPNRNSRIALLNYVDGEKRYILAPAKVGVGEMLMSGPDAEIRPGNAMALSRIPLGSTVHNIELKPGGGGKMVRAAGTSAQLVAREGKVATLRMPSSEVRQVSVDCRATVGEVGNAEFELVQIGKAGRARWKNHRPSVRGVAMNPVDHPLGGGEGKASGGRHPVTPWGKPEGRTRKKGKYSDHDIVRRRGSKRG